MFPFIGAGISIAGGAYYIGKLARGVESINNKVERLGRDFWSIKEDFIKVKHNQILCMDGKLSHSSFKRIPN